MKPWLTKELIEEVKKVFNPRYGQQLSDEQARQIGMNLANGLEVLLEPCKNEGKISVQRSN